MRVMKSLLASLLVVVFLVLPENAKSSEVDAATAQAIQNVISSQMEAFRHDDAEKAFSHAAQTIQHMFGNPERFMQMVRDGYQAVYRPRYVEFRNLSRGEAGRLIQHVLVEAPDGTLVMAVYPMTQDDQGNWRIAGVYLAPLSRKSA